MKIGFRIDFIFDSDISKSEEFIGKYVCM